MSMFKPLQSMNASFCDASPRRLTSGIYCYVPDELKQVSPFTQAARLGLLWICWVPYAEAPVGLGVHRSGVTGRTSSGLMVHPCSLGSAPLALPWLSSSTYTLAYRPRGLGDAGRVGTSPVKLTSHFPEVNPPATLTLERRLTVSVAARPALRGKPCFTISRKLALRLGRIVNPPQVLFPGSFVTTF